MGSPVLEGQQALAAVTRSPGADFVIEPVRLDPPKTFEALVRIVGSGICHTDITARDQGIPVPLPAVFGHEGAGVVEQVGPGVRSVVPGDHVVLSFASCGVCEPCLTGRPAACARSRELSFGGAMADGTHRIHQDAAPLSTFFGQSSFATYAVTHETNMVKVDADLDLALLAPLGCGIQTGSGTVLNSLRPQAGTSLAVFGCGTVGLSAVMAARIAGCGIIVGVDRHPGRLETARELGATHVVDASRADPVAEVRRITGGGVHFAVEAAGSEVTARLAYQSLGHLGRLALVGGGRGTLELDITDVLGGNKVVMGVIEGASVPQVFIPRLVNLFRQGRFPFDKLFRFYDFRDINRAVADSIAGGTIKPVIRMPG